MNMSSDTIKVVVRAKPLLNPQVKSVPWVIEDNTIYQVDGSNTVVGEHYAYDKIFGVDKKNVDLYETAISPVVRSAIEGINLTIFAYGATSSGKTYTMNGTMKDPGVIPRIIEGIFDEIQICSTRKFLLRASYVEIYSEIINDLLDKNNKDLKIREDIHSNINYNATEKLIKSCEECLDIMKMGTANRTTGETLINALSSRSHSIFRIIIESTPYSESEQDPVQVSQVNLIDLAGSERVSQTGATGQRFKEGAHINKSLTVLGLVIRQLVEKKEYISYRDSKLTRILSNTLGGNAETIIICNINLLSVEDTQSTLLFAQRAKSIKVKPKLTEIFNELSLTKRYTKECQDLKAQLNAELEKNQRLEHEREMSNREISDLTSRIQSMQEIFVKKEPIKKPPKRRHTFCSILSAISEEKESGTILRNADFTEKEISDMHNAIDSETLIHSNNSVSEMSVSNPIETNEVTPVKSLRERLRILSREYDELREFTIFEKSARQSFEQDTAQRIKSLTEECSDLRASRECSESQIQALILEEEKSKQLINDYEYMIELQKSRYEKRENELLEQIYEIKSKKQHGCYVANENILLNTAQSSTFEYEEMFDTIESLKKQNEKLQEVIDSQKNHDLKSFENVNVKLQEESNSLKLVNSELQNKISSFQSENLTLTNTICAIQLQDSHLKARNESLQLKCSDYQMAQDNLLSKHASTVCSLEKQISELKNRICEVELDLVNVKIELNDSLDKLLEITEELDVEEKKYSELQMQLEIEKALRKKAEIKLEQTEHSERGVRRFSSDSFINQKCKSLDSNVLQMLFCLKTILDPKPLQRVESNSDIKIIPQESSCFDLKLPGQNKNISSDNSSTDLPQTPLCIDLEKLKSFSSCYLENSTGSAEFMNYFQSVVSESSTLSGSNVSMKTSEEIYTAENKRENDPSNDVEKLKNEIHFLKLQQQSDLTKINNLQKQLDDYIAIEEVSTNETNHLLSQIDVLEKTNLDLILKISVKEDLVLGLQANLKEMIETKENLEFLTEKEKDNCKLIKTEMENVYQTLRKVESEKQELQELCQEKDKDLQQEIDCLNRNIKELKADFDKKEAENQTISSELQKMLSEKKDNLKMIKRLEQEILELIETNSTLHNQLDNCEKNNFDLKSRIRNLYEVYAKENENCKLVKTEMQNVYQTLRTVESEKQELRELLKKKKKNLLLEIDGLNMKFKEFMVDFEKKEDEIRTLTSELQKKVSENEDNLKIIKKMEQEIIDLGETNSTLYKRLDICEKNNFDLKSRISNFNEEYSKGDIMDKMYAEITRLKEILPPRDDSKKASLRELLMDHRKNFNYITKLEEIKYLVDRVNLLVNERNLLKHQNEIGYECQVEIHENMKREFELKKRQYDLLLADLKTLEDKHVNLRGNYDACKSESEELKSTLAKKLSKLENYRVKIENLAFENQNLAKKLSHMEELMLSNKNIEQNSQSAIQINKMLNYEFHESDKRIENYEKTDEEIQKLTEENRKLVDKIKQLENKNRQFVEFVPLKMKENTPRVLENLNRNSEVIESMEFETLKHKYEELKKMHESCGQQNLEMEATITSRKENKWKQQRTETHDSRRNIDLNTLCLESEVYACNNCESMYRELQKTKSEILQLRNYVESLSPSEFEILKNKYDRLKKLCRIRSEEIAMLKQNMEKMEIKKPSSPH